MRESLKEFLEIIESCNQPTAFHRAMLENLFLLYSKGWKQMLINAILDQFSKLK